MNVVNYLIDNKDVPLKKLPFNELDALLFSLAAYFPFGLVKKNKINAKLLLKFLKTYEPVLTTKRKLLDIFILTNICLGKRYKGIRFDFFNKKFDKQFHEQFQAITIKLKDFVFISFSGTDGTLTGWREDLNMSFLDIVPAEISASRYANFIRKKYPFKKIYIGGHSKGGRLAIRAASYLEKKKKLAGIFSFDGPEFNNSFYENKNYIDIAPLIHRYTPFESIFGRLINNQDNRVIVDSYAQLLLQHDAYTWEVEDDHFVTVDFYSDRSTELLGVINTLFNELSPETKNILIDTIFDFLEKRKDEMEEDVNFSITAFFKQQWASKPKEVKSLLIKVTLKYLREVIILIRLIKDIMTPSDY